MFLRMGFVVSHAGIYQAVLVVFVSLVLTVLTATSLSAIATNGRGRGWGRLLLDLTQSRCRVRRCDWAGLCRGQRCVRVDVLIGFAETVVGLYGPGPAVVIPKNATEAEAAALTASATDNYMTSRREMGYYGIVALIGLVVIMAVACAGANWVVKIDIGQLVVLIIGILTFFRRLLHYSQL